MWSVNGVNLQMVEGDWGIQLPVKVSGTTLTASDSLKFTFKTGKNKQVVLEKEFDGITQNTVNLELTEAETALFHAGNVYVYALDWYQDGIFMCNIVPSGVLKVVDKV